VNTASAVAAAEGKEWTQLDVDEQDRYFDLAKKQERRA
jgi:hypothetical protein